MNCVIAVSLALLGRGYAFTTFQSCVKRSRTVLWEKPQQSSMERAGAGGYSVLRQPVRWDAESDPEFEAPRSLKDDVSAGQQLNEDWWNDRSGFRQTLAVQEKATPRQASPIVPTAPTPLENMADLDLFQRTLDTLDYPIVLNALQDACTTVPARDLVSQAKHIQGGKKPKRRRKIPPKLQQAYTPLTAASFEGLKERYDAVREMQWIMDGQNDLLVDATYRNRKGYKESIGRPPLSNMGFDLKSILSIADQGQVLEGPEILEVATMMNTLENVQLWGKGLRAVETLDFVELPKMTDCVNVNTTLQELLHNAFDKDGRLSGKTFPMIGQLRAKVRTLKSDILDTLDSLLATPSIASKLALESGGAKFSEVNGRIVIPVDQKFNKASLGIIHDTSRSGKTLYVEPTEIVVPTNELRQAEAELRGEEARVWRLLSAEILDNRIELEASVAAVGQLDLVAAKVTLGRRLNGVIPTVGNEGIVSLRDARHPVLLLREIENVVGSDLDLGADGNQGLVLTGPNSGGKTVILKLLGLVALMARNGIPVPARAKTSNHIPRVDFFDPVLADIGDIQSVGGDLSTFSGHMLVCREVLAKSGQNALVLMDELGSGTDPAQGVAIAQALLEALVDSGSRVAITTHYMQLKQLAASDDRFAVGGMQFVNGRPTYKLLPGTVGESFALAVAERLELPKAVLNRANELLDSETRQMGDLIRELEDQKALVDQQAEGMAMQQQEMDKLEMQLRGQKFRLEEKQLSARRDEAKKFAKMLEEKEKVLEDILEKLKSDPSRKILAKSWDDIRFVKRDALTEAENVPSVLQAKAKKKAKVEAKAANLVPISEMREKPDLKVGDSVIVCERGPLFGKQATIFSQGRKPEVKLGDSGMVVRLKLSGLAMPNENVKPMVSTPMQRPRDPKNMLSNAAQKALEAEMRDGSVATPSGKRRVSTVSIRTQSNTVDVRGSNLDEAKSLILDRFDSCMRMNRMVVYILHGHGTRGVLKSKVRNWLRSEKELVKSFGPASSSDGGDAFTRVELN